MSKGDRVIINRWPTGSPLWFYIYNTRPQDIYEVDTILHNDEVYLVGHTNYIRKTFLTKIDGSIQD